MKFKNLLWLSLLLGNKAFAQAGCTDNSANNYNASATINDGSCTYDSLFLNVTLKGAIDSYADESSGLVFTGGKLYTHSDSGNDAELFQVDSTNGGLLQTITNTNHNNYDWEDVAADSLYIYVGDFGNNNGDRTNLRILRIAKSQIGTGSAVNVTSDVIAFSYADQTSFTADGNTNFNCEAFIVMGDSLYLFTKQGNLQTRCYKLPKVPGTYSISPYTGYNIKGKVTGAAYNAAINEVALIGYQASDLNSFMWLLNDFQGDMFFSGNKRKFQLGNDTTAWKTEGIEYVTPDELFISCETSDVPARLYRLYKPAKPVINTGIEEISNTQVNTYPNPSNGEFAVESSSLIENIEVFDASGKLTSVIVDRQSPAKVIIKEMPAGFYLLKISTATQTFYRKMIIE